MWFFNLLCRYLSFLCEILRVSPEAILAHGRDRHLERQWARESMSDRAAARARTEARVRSFIYS